MDSSKWAGKIRHTVSGKTCQRWVTDTPHKHTFHDKKFPDGTELEAENFCRDPSGEGQPWCFTTDKRTRWQFCPISHCTICARGWVEEPSTEYCYWLGDEQLTWADASSACQSIGASLLLPIRKEEIDLLTGKLSNTQDKLFWLNVYFDVYQNEWISSDGPVTNIKEQVSLIDKPTKAMCLASDRSGKFQVKSCLERNVYSCVRSGPFIKYQTRSNENPLQMPDRFTRISKDGPVTTYLFKFEFKGHVGATIILKPNSDTQSNKGYIIEIGSDISPKSKFSKIGSKKADRFITIPNLCDENEYREFWISWTNVNSNAVTLMLGRGSNVGRSLILSWTDQAGIKVSTVYIATVTKMSGNYRGLWRVRKETQAEKIARARFVNLALGKETKQSSTAAYFSTPNKAVDGCRKIYATSQCLTHTKLDFEPWWQVDLGRDYNIREIVIYKRGPECCVERLGYFRMFISMLSDTTLEQDVVYQNKEKVPPFIMHIPVKGKHGRYVKIDIPGRHEYLELAEVEVYEDIDASTCRYGWHENDKEAACYHISDAKMTWDVSKEYCEGINAQMVVPKTPREQLYLYELSLPTTKNSTAWLGLNDINTEGTFTTADGLNVAYKDWEQNEPNNVGSENCVSMRMDLSSFSGKWNDRKCDTPLRAACRKEETPTTTTSTKTTIPTTSTTKIATTIPIQKTLPKQGESVSSEGFTKPTSLASTNVSVTSIKSKSTVPATSLVTRTVLPPTTTTLSQTTTADFIALNVYGISTSVWLGMQDLNTDGHFDWADNSPLDYSNWAPNEPSSNHYDAYAHEPCVEMWTDDGNLGLWNDVKCSVHRGFLCSTFKDPSMPILSVCPNGYILLKQICYKVTTATQSWNQSMQSCSSDGATQMISIANPVDFILLRVLLGSVDLTEVWVGGTLNDNNLQWNDGSSPTVPARTSIPTGCLYSQRHILSSAECSENRAVICKI